MNEDLMTNVEGTPKNGKPQETAVAAVAAVTPVAPVAKKTRNARRSEKDGGKPGFVRKLEEMEVGGKDGNGEYKPITDYQFRRLETAWRKNWRDVEACEYAGVGVQQLRRYKERYPEIQIRATSLRRNNHKLAKSNLSSGLKRGDQGLSKWFLERRDANFAPKQEAIVTVNHSLTETEVTRQLANLLNTVLPGPPGDCIDITPEQQLLPDGNTNDLETA